jgi:hypothetical protein
MLMNHDAKHRRVSLVENAEEPALESRPNSKQAVAWAVVTAPTRVGQEGAAPSFFLPHQCCLPL